MLEAFLPGIIPALFLCAGRFGTGKTAAFRVIAKPRVADPAHERAVAGRFGQAPIVIAVVKLECAALAGLWWRF